MVREVTTRGALALAVLAAGAHADTIGPVAVGEEREYSAATPAVYPAGAAARPVVWSETIVSPGATFLRLHFRKLNLPVARISFQKDGSSFVCTGWLARGSNANTLVTNHHCVSTQAEVASVQARFNYQTTTCIGTTVGNVSTYADGTLLRTNASLDYTLLTLQGNPQAIWAHYTATTAAPAVGREFFLLQHPGGGWKKIAVWKDAAHTQRCDVSAANQTISGATPKSQMTYDCDTDGGSSGSPLMDALTGRIIGLHRVGDVGGSTCLNAATQMKNICADAGALLTCVDE